MRWQNWTHQPHAATGEKSEKQSSTEPPAETTENAGTGVTASPRQRLFPLHAQGTRRGQPANFEGSWEPHSQRSPQVYPPACLRDGHRVCPTTRCRQVVQDPDNSNPMSLGSGRVEQQEFVRLIPACFRWPQQLGRIVCSTEFRVEVLPSRRCVRHSGTEHAGAARKTTPPASRRPSRKLAVAVVTP